MEQERNDFDDLSDFLTEWEKEEIENEKNDALILALAKRFREHDEKDQIINPKQVQKVLSVYKKMKRAFDGRNVKVTCKLFQPYKNSGCISIEGKEIFFEDPTLFSETVRDCDCVDGYRKTNGNMIISFAYSKLTKLKKGR